MRTGLDVGNPHCAHTGFAGAPLAFLVGLPAHHLIIIDLSSPLLNTNYLFCASSSEKDNYTTLGPGRGGGGSAILNLSHGPSFTGLISVGQHCDFL